MKRELLAIIEDDEGVQEVYAGALEDSYELRIYGDGASFFADKGPRPALILLDIMLPDMDGYEILRRIRERDERVPVLIVSARADETSLIKGLNRGADDYLVKPFSILELLARVKAGLRRARLYVKKHDDFDIDEGNYAISYRGSNLRLTLKEFKLLRCLLSRAGTVVSREELFAEAWGEEFMGETRALDMHIVEIRDKLRQAGGDNLIATVRGVGYRME